MIYNNLYQSELSSKIKAGIYITGGMSKLPGIQGLAQQIFKDFSVQIGTIKNIQNEYIDFNDNTKSTLVGLILYSLNTRNFYELDSKKQLRLNKMATDVHKPLESISPEVITETRGVSSAKQKEDIITPDALTGELKDAKKEGLLSKALSNMKDWF